ncbi:MAG: hypothetical protein K8T25_18265 [Planctomycetia bacterium]|nr:hypothetical protein [Planctomycetia bacterium]
MSDAVNGGPVRWRDRLPWLILVRALRPALSARLLLCAAVGLLLMIGGWRVCWWMFHNSADPLITELRGPIVAGEPANVWPAWPWEPASAGFGSEGLASRWPDPSPSRPIAAEVSGVLRSSLVRVWQLTLPFQFMFRDGVGWTGLAFSLLCGAWSLAVWSFFGSIMTRTVALQLTREESVSLGQVVGFATRNWLSYFTAPLYPLLGVLLATLPLMLLGLIARMGVGALLVALIWPLALVAGLFMAVLLLGLFFGWPLMWGTISVEGNDAFDALSRSYAYTFQRPLKYLFYALVAILLGALGSVLVGFFAEAVVWLPAWAASWGSGTSRMTDLSTTLGLTGVSSYAAGVFVFWTSLVRLIAAGFVLSYFWSATTAIYLLLRRDVDAAEMDEIQLDQDETFGMPPLVNDEQGVPAAGDVAASSAAGGTNLRDEE